MRYSPMGQMAMLNVDGHFTPFTNVGGQPRRGESPAPRSLIR